MVDDARASRCAWSRRCCTFPTWWSRSMPRRRICRSAGDMAVVAAVLATALLSALGLAIALLGSGEMTLAGRERMTRALRAAAQGAAQLAIADLETAPDWTAVLMPGASADVTAVRARLADAALNPRPPWGDAVIDLHVMTAQVQLAEDDVHGPADAPQVWRLFANGPLETVAPGGGSGPWYLAVWIADDCADTDGDPDRDSNGAIALHAAAFGPGEAVASVSVRVVRQVSAGGIASVRVASIRPGP